MLPDKSIGCHKTFGLPKVRSCLEMVTKHKCQLWGHIRGTNKNTGEEVNRYGCAEALAFAMQTEVAAAVREAAGEVSEHRKENRAQAAQQAGNMAALNDNLIRMHQQTAQIGIAQARALNAIAESDEPRHLIEHHN